MAYNTIKVKKYLDVVIEKEAAAALYPGHLLELTSSNTVQKHSSADTFAVPMFALEDELQGKGIGDAYAAGSKVQVWVAQRGEQVYAVLRDGESVAIGDELSSYGDGTLAKSESIFESLSSINDGQDYSTRPIVGIALEAVDLSDSSGAEDSGELSWDNRVLIMVV